MSHYEILARIRQIETRANRLATLLCRSFTSFSLAPGFCPVSGEGEDFHRFSGFPSAQKPLKRLNPDCAVHTGLKPGANERPGRKQSLHSALRVPRSALT
jgi:hypothetical protein